MRLFIRHGTKGSSGLYPNGVVYLSPYVFGADLALMVASIGHELAHDWLAANDPTDAANDNWNETYAYHNNL
ncbi:MAG TPA: hypothetical protein VK518_02175 [Puia sp.]|nr:hypothetical protein [Puia sp.]